jgi:hypothetical protein
VTIKATDLVGGSTDISSIVNQGAGGRTDK